MLTQKTEKDYPSTLGTETVLVLALPWFMTYGYRLGSCQHANNVNTMLILGDRCHEFSSLSAQLKPKLFVYTSQCYIYSYFILCYNLYSSIYIRLCSTTHLQSLFRVNSMTFFMLLCLIWFLLQIFNILFDFINSTSTNYRFVSYVLTKILSQCCTFAYNSCLVRFVGVFTVNKTGIFRCIQILLMDIYVYAFVNLSCLLLYLISLLLSPHHNKTQSNHLFWLSDEAF